MFTLVTACGGGGDGDGDGVASISEPNAPSTTAPKNEGSEIDQMRAYAKCMREHGVDVKDPEGGAGGGGIGIAVEGGEEKEKVDKANEACKEHLPNGGEPEKPTAEDLDQAREMAKCLREHGIEVKEPTMEDPGIGVSAGDGGNDPDEVNKAMEECSPDGAETHTDGKPAK
jgi:hypothetical protein